MNKHYYGYTYSVDGIETLGIIPLTIEASFQFGFYDFKQKALVLSSKDKHQDVKVLPKLNDIGQQEFKNVKGRNFPLIERRLIEDSLTFSLRGNDVAWFLANMVENSPLAGKIIDKADEQYAEKLKQATPVTEDSGKVDESLLN